MILPKKLHAGDLVRIISPAGKAEPEYVKRATEVLRSWGLNVDVAPHALSESGRFSGTEKERCRDLIDALTDPNVKAIFCSRGGYGAVQLLDHLPIGQVCMRPKWLIGYSDITVLHALWSREGVISLHAPMSAHLAEYPDNESSHALKRILFGHSVDYETATHPLNRKGTGSGHLTGGNLSVLCGLRGTQYDFDYADSILFLEDIGEQPYKLERMLYQLKLGGVFEQIKGLIVGQFTECPEDPGMKSNIYEMIRSFTERYAYPVCFDYPVGHVAHNLPMPEGAKVQLKVTDKKVSFETIH